MGILRALEGETEGPPVLSVENISAPGLPLEYLRKTGLVRKPASLEIAAFLCKGGVERPPLDGKYKAFTIGPEFVVGYGLDYQQKYRSLPFVGIMEEE